MPDTKLYDDFETTLQNGLIKVCQSYGYLKDGLMESPDIEAKWDDYIKDYVADAVSNFNEYPQAALSWAGFLGMGVAYAWDKDWKEYETKPYSFYYGSRKWDDMDDHILNEFINYPQEQRQKLYDLMDSMASACLGLIRHQGIEAQTADGFYCLVRAFSVFYRIGASLELERLSYKKVVVS